MSRAAASMIAYTGPGRMGAPRNYGEVLRVNTGAAGWVEFMGAIESPGHALAVWVKLDPTGFITINLAQGADGLQSTISIRARPAGKNISAQVDVSGVRETYTLLALAPHDMPPCGPKEEEPRLLSRP
jgi:hypothetical protein